MSNGENQTDATSRGGSPPEQPVEAATQKAIADGIEAAIGIPASIEEEQMLEAAELLEVELAED